MVQIAHSNFATRWQSSLLVLVLLQIFAIILFRDTVQSMVTIWYRSETFTHGFVVLPITLWLIWRRRLELATLTPRPNLFMSVPIACFSVLWLMGDLVAVNSVTQFALVAILVAIVPAILGFAVASRITFPLAFLFFAVPIGEFVMPQLMNWTANFTVVALRLSGIPVYREGLSFVIPSGHWSVVEACSGVRYLIASLTVGTLYAYLNYQSTARRVLFILASIIVPIVANWARAYLIVLLGHLSGNTLAVGVDHLIYGWAFFGIVIMLMFVIGARWSEADPAVDLPIPSRQLGSQPVSTSQNWFVAVATVVILAVPIVVKRSLDSTVQPQEPTLAMGGDALGVWHPVDGEAINFKPHFQNPSAEVKPVYQSGEQVVAIYLGYYRNQNYDRKLVSSNNVLITSDDQTWRQVASGSRTVTINGQGSTVRSAELLRAVNAADNQPQRLLLWQIYWINGTLTSNDYLAKVYGALYQLLGRGDDSAVIMVYTATDRTDGADKALAAFISDNYAAIDATLRAARDNR